MTDLRKWENDLLAKDGSCRDINLAEHLSREAAIELLNVLPTEWSLCQAPNIDGLTVSPSEFPLCMSTAQGYLCTLWKNGAFIEQMQCYMCWDATGVFSELTFFPSTSSSVSSRYPD